MATKKATTWVELREAIKSGAVAKRDPEFSFNKVDLPREGFWTYKELPGGWLMASTPVRYVYENDDEVRFQSVQDQINAMKQEHSDPSAWTLDFDDFEDDE